MPMNNGLMRYHSAPTSIFASLLDEDFVPPGSDAFAQVEESEFARFLDDNLCMAHPLLDSKPSLPTGCNSMPPFTTEEGGKNCSTVNETRPQLQMEQQRLATQKSQCMAAGCSRGVIRGPLASISEHSANESPIFCSPTQLNLHMRMGNLNTPHGNLPNPLNTSIPNTGGLPYMKSNLAQHNSPPADVLSRLVKDESTGETFLHFGSSFAQASKEGSTMKHIGTTSLLPTRSTTFNQVQEASEGKDGRGVMKEARRVKSRVEESKRCLLRQSSSPARLLSKISFGGMSSSTNTTLSSSLLSRDYCEEDKRGGAYQAATSWDDIVSKECPSIYASQSSELTFTNQEAPPVREMCPRSLSGMEVLCKVSAKRGCATHPRSITERVRRKKINEGIRKLQELMPNMEKQTNIVTMLDEAVEYVKSLQRKVQELSESQPKCNGMCHLKANA